jgi:hypothetical protein
MHTASRPEHCSVQLDRDSSTNLTRSVNMPRIAVALALSTLAAAVWVSEGFVGALCFTLC